MSRQYMLDRWCVRCGRKTPTPFLVDTIENGWLSLPGKVRALDIGCGNGRNTQYLRSLGFEVTGVDMCPGAWGVACRLGQEHIPERYTSRTSLVLLNYVLMFLDDAELTKLALNLGKGNLATGCYFLVEMYPAKDSECITDEACTQCMQTFRKALGGYGRVDVVRKTKLREIWEFFPGQK